MGRTRISPKQIVAAVDSSGNKIDLSAKIQSFEASVGFIKGKVATNANLPASPQNGWQVFVEDEKIWKLYNGTSWENLTTGGGGGASDLEDLTDVDLTGLATNDVLLYDGTKWIAATLEISDINNLESTLNNKANSSSLGTAASKDVGTSSGNIPELNASGKLDTSILPAIAITDTFEVSSQIEMLALTAEKGDVAVRSDINKSFILADNSPSTLASWIELKSPTDTVLSVNGETGAVTLNANDIGAEPTISSKGTAFNKDFGTAADTVAEGNHTHTFSSLTSKPTTLSGYGITDAANSVHSHAISDVTNLQTALDGKQETITGAATTITAADLTVSRALVSNTSGKVGVSSVTSTELGHLSGVTSAIQTQLNGKASTTHTQAATTVTYNAGAVNGVSFPTSPNASPTDVQKAIENLFQYANSGKSQIATAIGSPATASDSFSTLAGYINNLSIPSYGVAKNIKLHESVNAKDLIRSYYKEWNASNLSSGLFPSLTGISATGANAVAWSDDNKYMAIGGIRSTASVWVYSNSSETFTLTSPSTQPTTTCNSVAFSKDATYLATANSNSVIIYKRAGDLYSNTKPTWTNVASLASSPQARGVSWSPDSLFCSFGDNSTPFIYAYFRDGDTFTKLSNPSSLPNGTVVGTSWSSDGVYLACVTGSSAANSAVYVYKKTGTGASSTLTLLANGFGSGVSSWSSGSVGTAGIGAIAFSPDDQYLAVALNVSPYIKIFKFNKATESFSDVSSGINATTSFALRGVAWSPDSMYVGFAHGSGTWSTDATASTHAVFQRSYKADTFTKLAPTSVQPGGQGNGIAFSGDQNYYTVAHLTTAPYTTTYKNASNATPLFVKASSASTSTVKTNDKAFGITKAAGNIGDTISADIIVGGGSV